LTIEELAMERIEVRHELGDRFEVSVRGHRLLVDQPFHDGGTDAGPTPTELFVAGLAACVGFYAERFMVRHRIDVTGMSVACAFELAYRPSRVGWIEIDVQLPTGFPEERLAALQAVIERCTVHNSLRRAPEVRMRTTFESPSGLPDPLAAV
jgi:uncharacterized OsmC-like protein